MSFAYHKILFLWGTPVSSVNKTDHHETRNMAQFSWYFSEMFVCFVLFVWWGLTSLSTPYWVTSWRSVLLAEETGCRKLTNLITYSEMKVFTLWNILEKNKNQFSTHYSGMNAHLMLTSAIQKLAINLVNIFQEFFFMSTLKKRSGQFSEYYSWNKWLYNVDYCET